MIIDTKQAIEALRQLEAFDVKEHENKLYFSQLDNFKHDLYTEFVDKAQKRSVLEERPFKEILKELCHDAAMKRAERLDAKRKPFLAIVRENSDAIATLKERLLKEHHLVWEHGRKAKAIKDDYAKVWDDIVIIETLSALVLPNADIYGLRIGIGNSIYLMEVTNA